MKNKVCILLVLVMMLCALVGVFGACDETLDASQGLKLELSDDERSYVVAGIGDCSDLDVVIPSEHNNKPVTTIDERAFDGNGRIKSITITNGVTTIKSFAFYGCWNLEKVIISKSVTSIEPTAFYGCSSLTSFQVKAGNSAYKAKDGNLYSKNGKTLVNYAPGKQDREFSVPKGVTTIGKFAFASTNSVERITLPSSVKQFGEGSFCGCPKLANVNIPDGVTTFSVGMFLECKSLSSINIPSSVTTIEKQAFYNCSSLTTLYIPSSVTTIAQGVAYGCQKLTQVFVEDPAGWYRTRSTTSTDILSVNFSSPSANATLLTGEYSFYILIKN